MTGLFRSLIFVPGNNPRFLEKAKSLQADIVCLDLEDSVPDAEKKGARGLIRGALKERSGYASQVFVRTNPPGSDHTRSDLQEILQKGIDGIVVPKVDDIGQLKKIERVVAGLERKRKLGRIQIIPSIESPEGVINCYEIASSGRVPAVVFGVFDLLNEMGIEYSKQPEGARYARAKIALDASAAGVAAIDAIWQDIRDEKGLKADCKIGKSLGYSGKSIIHPSQIPAAHRAFHPNRTEIAWAHKVCRAYDLSAKGGRGATTIDGKMIDEVHYKRAVSVLDLSKARA